MSAHLLYLSVFCTLIYFFFFFKKLLLLVWLCQAEEQPFDFYQGGVSRRSESAQELEFLWRAAPAVPKNNPNYVLLFSSGVFWSAPAVRRMHTLLRARWLSQDSNAWTCLPIHTGGEDQHPPALTGEQKEERVTERWQLSISRFLCCRAKSWWENVSCYLSPPTPLFFCLCLWF